MHIYPQGSTVWRSVGRVPQCKGSLVSVEEGASTYSVAALIPNRRAQGAFTERASLAGQGLTPGQRTGAHTKRDKEHGKCEEGPLVAVFGISSCFSHFIE